MTGVFFGAIEGVLRLCGLPSGTFRGAFATTTGLWSKDSSLIIKTGIVPYRVEANAHGFRGPALRIGLAAAKHRIVAIGDSFTDGFFVDNSATYPAQLSSVLKQLGQDVEVINAARGGGSIDRFQRILSDLAVPLAPDLVLVTFITNDVVEVGSYQLPSQIGGALSSTLPQLFVGHTAIGEGLMDLYLRLRTSQYSVQHDRRSRPRSLDQNRYLFPGGEDYRVNSQAFMQRYRSTDARLLQARFSPDLQAMFDRYLDGIDRFHAVCHQHGITMLFLYVPPYPQIYLPETPTHARDLIQRRVESLGGEFLDLTTAFRAAPKSLGPLHLAPQDFHPNPKGYTVMARAIADYILKAGLLER